MTTPSQTFVPKISPDVPWEVAHHITLLYQKLNGVAQAVVTAHTAAVGTTTVVERIQAGGGGGGGGFSAVIGFVNDQAGHTSYTTQPGDNGALIILNDASPIAVTLGVASGTPWFCWMTNLGAGTATLTPVSGTVNGSASFSLLQNYTTIVAFDGVNFWVGPSELSFNDITGIVTVAQGGTGTATPGLVAGAGIAISGTWPDQTIAATANTLLQPPAFPGTTPGMTTFPNLQELGSAGWSLTGGTSSSGGTNTGSSAVTYNNASPALTAGGSIALTSNGNGYNTQLYTQHPNADFLSSNCLLLTDVTVDLWFYIPSSSSPPQALEGPNVTLYNGTYQMYPSVQADSATGFWHLWNGTAWVATTYSCTSVLAATNVWQHMQVHYQFNAAANQFTYQDLIVNSVVVFQHLGTTYTGSVNAGAVSIKTQFQIDNTSSAVATTIYYDGITTRAWIQPQTEVPTASTTASNYSVPYMLADGTTMYLRLSSTP